MGSPLCGVIEIVNSRDHYQNIYLTCMLEYCKSFFIFITCIPFINNNFIVVYTCIPKTTFR